MNGYDILKGLAKEAGVPVSDLLVMARQNDLFFCGSPAQTAQAEWFTHLFDRFSFTAGVHLRRVHYQLISQREPVALLTGEPYQNTDEC
jgi:hypothetical protein